MRAVGAFVMEVGSAAGKPWLRIGESASATAHSTLMWPPVPVPASTCSTQRCAELALQLLALRLLALQLLALRQHTQVMMKGLWPSQERPM